MVSNIPSPDGVHLVENSMGNAFNKDIFKEPFGCNQIVKPPPAGPPPPRHTLDSSFICHFVMLDCLFTNTCKYQGNKYIVQLNRTVTVVTNIVTRKTIKHRL